jgi:hypothetical protein
MVLIVSGRRYRPSQTAATDTMRRPGPRQSQIAARSAWRPSLDPDPPTGAIASGAEPPDPKHDVDHVKEVQESIRQAGRKLTLTNMSVQFRFMLDHRVPVAAWQVGRRLRFLCTCQCARAQIVGKESIHRACSAGQYWTSLLAVHELGDPGIGMADEVGDVFDRHA